MAFLPIVLLSVAGGALYMNRSRRPESPQAGAGASQATSSASPLILSNGQSRAPGWLSQRRGEPFLPGPADVLIVKAMMGQSLSLPPEILDIIIDHAEYWPCTESSIEFTSTSRPRITGGRGIRSENRLLIRTPPIGFTQADVNDAGAWRTTAPSETPSREPVSPEHFKTRLSAVPSLERPVRKVVFKVRSKDQGWGGNLEHHNTFRGSWTWFEAGLERFEAPDGEGQPGEVTIPFDATTLRPVHPTGETITKNNGQQVYQYPLHPDRVHTIQRNRTAARDMADYEVTWRWTDDIRPETPEAEQLDEQGRGEESGNGEFVRSLRLGDVVSIWGMARFGGWSNNVEKLSVQVYWAL